MKAVKTLLVAGSLMLVTGAALADGESVYNSGCAACHATGVAGAPKVGDKATVSEALLEMTTHHQYLDDKVYWFLLCS